MGKKLSIVVNASFQAIHSWPDCPIEEVSFLKYPHRHVFDVCIKLRVVHEDRQLEFFVVKKLLEDYLRTAFDRQVFIGVSCEMFCEKIHKAIITKFPSLYFVSVFEDGENGAEVLSE